jgi:hypothetical protein
MTRLTRAEGTPTIHSVHVQAILTSADGADKPRSGEDQSRGYAPPRLATSASPEISVPCAIACIKARGRHTSRSSILYGFARSSVNWRDCFYRLDAKSPAGKFCPEVSACRWFAHLFDELRQRAISNTLVHVSNVQSCFAVYEVRIWRCFGSQIADSRYDYVVGAPSTAGLMNFMTENSGVISAPRCAPTLSTAMVAACGVRFRAAGGAGNNTVRDAHCRRRNALRPADWQQRNLHAPAARLLCEKEGV